MTRSTSSEFRSDWVSKTLAGVVLGFTLALALSGLYALAASGVHLSERSQLAMWATFPSWMVALAGGYACRSGARAWLLLGALNLAAWGLFFLLRLP